MIYLSKQAVTTRHVEVLLNDEVLGSSNAKRINNLYGEFVKTHMWGVRDGALQGQPGIHGTGGVHGICCYKFMDSIYNEKLTTITND